MTSVNTKVVQCAVGAWASMAMLYAIMLWVFDNNIERAINSTAMTLVIPIALMWLTTLSKSQAEVLGNLTFTGLMVATGMLFFFGHRITKDPIMILGALGVLFLAALNGALRDVDEMASKPFLAGAFITEAMAVVLTLYWLTPATPH